MSQEVSEIGHGYSSDDFIPATNLIKEMNTLVQGKIIIAEDQLINVTVLKQQLQAMNLLDQCIFCFDGAEAFDVCVDTIKEAVSKCADRSHVEFVKPIALLMLDFQMPKMNGIQLLEKLKLFYKHFDTSSVIGCKGKTSKFRKVLKLEEPTYVFLTAYSSNQFKQHIQSLGVDLQFEKPLQLEQLRRIVQIGRVEKES